MTSLPSFRAASTTFAQSSLCAAAGPASAELAASMPRTLLRNMIPSSRLAYSERADALLDELELCPAEHQDQDQHDEPDDAHFLGFAAHPHLQHHYRQHLGTRRVEQDRGAELAHDAEEDQHPADREGRPGERDQDAAQRLPPAGAVHARAFLDVRGDLLI